MSLERGLVLWGANNIFSLRIENPGDLPAILEARIKGKKLVVDGDSYNPLSPGDRVEVEVEADAGGSYSAMIVSRLARDNEFGRWNKKRQGMQTIGANIDELCILSSPVSPPFRPRFIDRAIALGEYNQLSMRIILNKADQGIDEDLSERLEYYEHLGYGVDVISVKENEGIAELISFMKGKTVMLLGQSGVGKSSLIQTIFPDEQVKISGISDKYNRGRHTTVLAKSYEFEEGGLVIDTPGIRELDLYGIEPEQLGFLFVEFGRYSPDCKINMCRHVHEPDCAVKDAVAEGLIHEDRYDSYINTLIVMEQSARQMKDWKFKRL